MQYYQVNAGSFKNKENAVLNDPKKEPEKRFWAIFCSLVCWVDLILHIVIGLNALQHLSALPDPERSFKNHKKSNFE